MPERQPDAPLRDSWRDRIALEIRGRAFPLLAVLQAAEIRGDLEAEVARSRQAHALEAQAQTEGWEPDMTAVEEAIDAFRYERNLVTVEETEAWLARRGLTVDELSDHFVRRHWVELTASRASGELTDGTGTEVAPAVWAADLFFTGAFTRLARHLAREVLIAGETGSEPETGAVEAVRRRTGLEEAAFRAWREAWGLDPGQVAEFVHWQEGFARQLRGILTPENRSTLLAEQYSLLKRVELEVLEFDTEDVAREAFLCATADGLALKELATQTGYPMGVRTAFVGQLPASWRVPVTYASPGRVLDPLEDAGRYRLCRLVREEFPTLKDPAVVAELDALLLQRHCKAAEIEEVRWHLQPEDTE